MQAQKLPNLMKDEKYGSAEQIMALPETRLIAILRDSSASVFAKAKACNRLAVIGSKAAIPGLGPLLSHPELSTYARFALEPMPDPAASDILRGALDQVKGPQLVGVINSLGKRRDTKALAALEKLRHSDHRQVADAAEAALARIRPLV